MKKLFIALTIGIALLPSPLLAESPSPAVTVSTTASPKTAATTKKVDQLRNKLNKEIERRITGLGKLTTKINNTKRLDNTTKTTLTTEISNEITSLQTIKTAVTSESDIAKLREQVKSLTALHKSYAFYVPRLQILATVDTMQGTAESLTTAADALSQQIASAKNTGSNTASAESSLATMRTQTAAAKKQLEETEKAVLSLTLSGYPTNKADLKNAKKQLDAAHKQIQDARKAATTIKTELTKMNTSKTPQATISPSPAL